MNISLLIVHFFTERKRVVNFFCTEENLETALDKIGRLFPESILVAYHNDEAILAHRPKKMMEEKADVLSGKMDDVEFLIRWRIVLGQQIMPDLKLPKSNTEKEEIFSPEDLIPKRAEFVEITPCEAFG